MAGRIFLIPVTLGGNDFQNVIPEKVIGITLLLRYFVVENIRSARRYLRLIDRQFPINDTIFFELNEHTKDADIGHFLEPALRGSDIGIMSEAGLPCIADPGAKIVSMAHKKNLKVIPLSGPSSIILALISSGFNGQNFCFNGYLPVKPAERIAGIRELQKKAREGYTQVFMETPYRSQRMLDSILAACDPDTELCIAADITLPTELIQTRKISEWISNIPSLNDKLVIFVLQ
jgi:16S rRNA (cytidine1402-2'-O)-methyltransferase